MGKVQDSLGQGNTYFISDDYPFVREIIPSAKQPMGENR
jgi:hypothetical protein